MTVTLHRQPSPIRGKVTGLQRMHNTPNGNPRWEVTIHADDGLDYIVRSTPDSSLAGRIDNAEFRNTEHTFTINHNGQLGLLNH